MRRLATGLGMLSLLCGLLACTDYPATADLGQYGHADAGQDASPGWLDVGGSTLDAGVACSNDGTAPACADPLTCCSGHCVDVMQNPAHCGSCGVQCTAAQFCAGSSGCTTLGFSTLCDNDVRIALRSGTTGDDVVLLANANAVAAQCAGAVIQSSLLDTSLVDQTSFAPLVGVGNTLLLHGGPFVHLMVRHFEETGIAPLRFVYNSTQDRNQIIETNGALVLDVPAAQTTDSHDYFVVELFADPARGALILATYGFLLPGSQAAGWYLVNHLLAAPAPQASWYVVEWTDLDGDLAPSSIDEFTPVTNSTS